MNQNLLVKYCIAIKQSMKEGAPQRLLFISPNEVNKIFIMISGKCIIFPDGLDMNLQQRVDARWIANLLVVEKQRNIERN